MTELDQGSRDQPVQARGARRAVLSSSQLATLADHGTEHRAEPGEELFGVGDTSPLVAIVDGEAAMVDAGGHELYRDGPFGFLGELNLLSEQRSDLSVVALTALRYVAVTREALHELLLEDGPLGDVLLSSFTARREALQLYDDVGMEIIGPRSSDATREVIDFARRNVLTHTWRDTDRLGTRHRHAAMVSALRPEQLPLVMLPGGRRLLCPTPGELSRALGIGLELAPFEEVDMVIVGGGPAGLGAAVYAASEGLEALVVECRALGGQAGGSRRIENYLGFPAGLSGSDLTNRAVTQARKFGARMAAPYRAMALEPRPGRHLVHLDTGGQISATTVVLATGAQYRRLDVAGLRSFEGTSVFYAAGPPEAQRCAGRRVAVVGGGNSAAQAAIWLSRGGALVTLVHRREDLRETMSEYLIRDLRRHGVGVRGRCEVAALHGQGGDLESVTLTSGEDMPVASLFLFLGAAPSTDWLAGIVARDEDGFVLTGARAGRSGLLETSVPGVYAIGDARAESIKRCAAAVGEGAMVVRYAHGHLTGHPA